MKSVLYLLAVAAALIFLAFVYYRPVDTFVPNGQEYRPSGASEGYGVKFMKTPDIGTIVFEGASGYLHGISIDSLTPTDADESAIYIGEGWDCMLATKDGCMNILKDGSFHWTPKAYK